MPTARSRIEYHIECGISSTKYSPQLRSHQFLPFIAPKTQTPILPKTCGRQPRDFGLRRCCWLCVRLNIGKADDEAESFTGF
jgi:hypothetical protein